MLGQNQAAQRDLDALSSADARAEKLSLLLTLLERATSLQVVKDFLKAKNLPHSAGSWEEMRSKRLVPAYNEGNLALSDLHALLRRTEGFGRQHVFLFQIRKTERIASLLDERRLVVAELTGLSADPLLVDLPDAPTVVDVRSETVGGHRCLSIKEIEKRSSKKLLSEETTGDRFTKTYQVELQRAINFARFWSTGLLELRIASRDNSTKYREDLAAFFIRLKSLFPKDDFAEVSLKRLKTNLWNSRVALKDVIRFSTYTLQDDEGMTLRANAALSTDDLGEHEGVAKSFEQFQAAQVSCRDSNIYFKPEGGDESGREIHVLLSGEDNEFAVTSAITEEEYEHVLRQIIKHHL